MQWAKNLWARLYRRAHGKSPGLHPYEEGQRKRRMEKELRAAGLTRSRAKTRIAKRSGPPGRSR